MLHYKSNFEDGTFVKTIDVSSGSSLLPWFPDGSALNYVLTTGGVSNIWSLPLNGAPSKQLTNWKTDRILDFQWCSDPKQLAVTRGRSTRDLVLIENVN